MNEHQAKKKKLYKEQLRNRQRYKQLISSGRVFLVFKLDSACVVGEPEYDFIASCLTIEIAKSLVDPHSILVKEVAFTKNFRGYHGIYCNAPLDQIFKKFRKCNAKKYI